MPASLLVSRDIRLKLNDLIGLFFVPPEKRVASLAQERPDMSSRMAVIDKQSTCFLFANGTPAALLRSHPLHIINRQSILIPKLSRPVVLASCIWIRLSPISHSGVSLLSVICAVFPAIPPAAFDTV